MEPTGPAITVEAFQGPMDLLLHLVRVREVDIHDIPIADIADQYVAAVGDLSRVDIEAAGEFLVMAATLVQIKSRVIAAENMTDEDRADRDEAERVEDDPRAELVKQLLEYKRTRERADALESRLADWQARVRVAPAARPDIETDDDDAPVDLEDLSLADIVAAFEHIAEAIQFDRLGDHAIVDDDTPIELHQADVLDRLQRVEAAGGRPALALVDVFTGRNRLEAIGLFLAILELLRNHQLSAWRAEGEGGIWVGRVAAEAANE
ncbi:MAG: segregation/condensation protein A [Planctomycetota bacterium]